MSSPFYSPRGAAPRLADRRERSALVGRQRVRRVYRGRARGRALAAAGLAAAGAIALGAAAGGVRWLLTSPWFAVASVEVRGASRLPVERVRAAAAVAPGTNLWRIDPAAVAARVEALPEVHHAQVVRALPNRLTVELEERRPFTLVHAGRLHWLDEEGRVVGAARTVPAPALPVISGLSEEEMVTLRTSPTPRARAAVGLVRTLLRSGSVLVREISEIDMSRPEGPVLYTVDGIEVRLGGEEWEERLARLEGVLAQVASDPARVRVIDLRFRGQVVLTTGGQG